MNKKLYSPLGRLLGSLLIVAVMCFSQSVFALPELKIEHGPNGPVVYGVRLFASDLDPSLNYRQQLVSPVYMVVLHQRQTGGGAITSTYVCDIRGRTNVPGEIYKKTKDPNVKRQYEDDLVQFVNYCSQWRRDGIIHNLPVLGWTLYVQDGYWGTSDHSLWAWEYMPLSPNDNTCTTSVTDTIDFGNISPNSQNGSASGSLTIVCNINVNVTVIVNENSNLISMDGSIISFDRVNKMAVMAETPTVVPIRSTMINGPKSPGSYMWFAPVIVSYD